MNCRFSGPNTRLADDAISFYRFDPLTLKRVSRDHPDGRPNIRRVQIHSMMDPASFKRHRFHYMRIALSVPDGQWPTRALRLLHDYLRSAGLR